MKYAACAALAALASTVAYAKPPSKVAVVGAGVVMVAPKHYQYATLSKQAGSTVSLGMVEEDVFSSGALLLNLTVSNTGTGLVGLTPDEVRVTADDGKPVAMLTYSQMAALAHKELGGKRFGTGLGNFVVALGAANAGTYQTRTSIDGSVSNAFGGPSSSFSATATTTSVDHVARARAGERAAAYIAANRAKLKAAEDNLDDQARGMSFAPSVVPPGEWRRPCFRWKNFPTRRSSSISA